MNILFKNSYTKDKDLLKEIYKYFYFKRPIPIIVIIITILLLIKTIIEYIMYGYFNHITFLIAIIYLEFKVIYYFKIVSTQLNSDLELNNSKPLEVKTIVTDDFIQNKASNGAVNEITYSKLKRGYQTKNLILFISKANLIYIFRKDTFLNGDFNDFIKFIQSKGIKIK